MLPPGILFFNRINTEITGLKFSRSISAHLGAAHHLALIKSLAPGRGTAHPSPVPCSLLSLPVEMNAKAVETGFYAVGMHFFA